MHFTSKRSYDFSILGYAAICVVEIVFFVLLYFFVPAVVNFFWDRIREDRIPNRYSGVAFVLFLPVLLLFTPLRRKTIILYDDKVLHEKTVIPYTDIKLEYSANPFVTAKGTLLVSSKTDKYASFTVGSRYKKCHIIWEELLNRVNAANPDADIDPQIEQKLYR